MARSWWEDVRGSLGGVVGAGARTAGAPGGRAGVGWDRDTIGSRWPDLRWPLDLPPTAEDLKRVRELWARDDMRSGCIPRGTVTSTVVGGFYFPTHLYDPLDPDTFAPAKEYAQMIEEWEKT